MAVALTGKPPKILVIGAGVGGLTAAAVLMRAGLPVTLLEAHVYPGGCAGTFFHQGYRFDAGATLAGGFAPDGPMALVASKTGITRWDAEPDDLAMVVHLPDGTSIERWGDERRHHTRKQIFGQAGNDFFQWQERTADSMWAFAMRVPNFPPQSPAQFTQLANDTINWLRKDLPPTMLPGIAMDAFRPVAVHLRNAPENLRLFIDGQLQISSQTTSRHANALYSASALDLPRRGVVHLRDGMGGIASVLAQAFKQQGGDLHYRQQVTRIERGRRHSWMVHTNKGTFFQADHLILNLPPWNIANLLGDNVPGKLRDLTNTQPEPDGWGAFMVYVGAPEDLIPSDFPIHHQVITGEPLGEGRSIFLSISPEWDHGRAPEGFRAITISTHTSLLPWWNLYRDNREAYYKRKEAYLLMVLAAAERILPALASHAALILSGTPITFERFTHRERGWVGGFPQTSLLRTWGPGIAPGLWMVGDSIFPGQSMPAVALGGLRVAENVLESI